MIINCKNVKKRRDSIVKTIEKLLTLILLVNVHWSVALYNSFKIKYCNQSVTTSLTLQNVACFGLELQNVFIGDAP